VRAPHRSLSCLLALSVLRPPYSHAATAIRMAPLEAPISSPAGLAAGSRQMAGGAFSNPSLSLQGLTLTPSLSAPALAPAVTPMRLQGQAAAVPARAASPVPVVRIRAQEVRPQTQPEKAAAVTLRDVSRALAATEDSAAGAEQSGRDAPAALKRISVSKDPGHIWDNSAERDEASDPVPATAEDTRVLLRPGLEADPTLEGGAAPQPLPDPRNLGQARVPETTWTSSIKDHLQYAAIVLSAFWWRTTSHLVSQWRALERAFRSHGAESPAVRSRLPFFLSTLILGSTGRFGPFGLRGAANRVVLEDAWAVFNRFFPEDDASTEAFSRFLARAQTFNPNRRVTQFRKFVTTGLLGAAVLSTAELPSHFDKLASLESGRALIEFQAGPQQRVLKLFTALVQETILEMNADLPPGKRIVGALLMGSFANGAAGPASDLDLQTIAEGGSSAHIPDFYSRLDAKWAAAKMDNPISDFQYALPLSKTLITHIHREHYLILSPYPEVVAGLQRSAEEELTDRPTRVRGLHGVAFHVLYVAWLTTVLAVYSAWAGFRRMIGRPLPDVPAGH